MGKPWARYEVGFISHPKFRALPGNAICLWVEGKNYADEHHTDGYLPAAEVKLFRFYSKHNVELLMTSAGQKAANRPEQWSPLWEAHVVGYKMHDYLDHNDCRDKVLDRIERIEQERQKERERKAKWRAEQALSRGTHGGTNRAVR